MNEKPVSKPEFGTIAEENKENKEDILEDVIFRENITGSKKQYVSSAEGRKAIVLSELSPTPELGVPYRVRIIEDTEPKNPTRGKLIAEIIIDPEKEKERMGTLLEEAERAFANNDFGTALARLNKISELAGIPKKGIEEKESMPGRDPEKFLNEVFGWIEKSTNWIEKEYWNWYISLDKKYIDMGVSALDIPSEYIDKKDIKDIKFDILDNGINKLLAQLAGKRILSLNSEGTWFLEIINK